MTVPTAAGVYSAARQPKDDIDIETSSGTSAAPAFWQVDSSEYHAPRDAGSGNHARKTLVTDGHPNDWRKPLKPQSAIITVSESVAAMPTEQRPESSRQTASRYLGETASMSGPLSRAHAPYVISNVEPSVPPAALPSSSSLSTDGSQKP